jgi:hypothetical protein
VTRKSDRGLANAIDDYRRVLMGQPTRGEELAGCAVGCLVALGALILRAAGLAVLIFLVMVVLRLLGVSIPLLGV